MSPASNSSHAAHTRTFGSPVKSGNGTKGTIAKLELFRQGGTQYEPQTMVTRNLREESTINTTAGNYVHVSGSKNNIVGNGNNDVIFYIERPLEKIEERHSESETEIDKDSQLTDDATSLPIFGIALEVAVERNRCHDGIPLPMVVRQCIDHIEEYGLNMEGVYRSSGVKSKVNKLNYSNHSYGKIIRTINKLNSKYILRKR